jgi:4-hydroxythreonine-4-phosphate dehydrogenase
MPRRAEVREDPGAQAPRLPADALYLIDYTESRADLQPIRRLDDAKTMTDLPRLLLTLGDVAGIGPEIAVRAWGSPELHRICRPVVIGDAQTLRDTANWVKSPVTIQPVMEVDKEDAEPNRLLCLQATGQDLRNVPLGQVSAAAGRAAYDFLCAAIDLTMARKADGIVTLPLHKEGLHAAGLPYPGHTEILAERTGTKKFAMMLHVANKKCNLAVTHVTLHMALRDVFAHLSTEAVLEKITLTGNILTRLLDRAPRIGVCGLNPHASDGGLFGDEESRLIAPAVAAAQRAGWNVSGPWPSDTLFLRAFAGEFDGIVAMYHDQGHIAVKLMAGYRAVNVSLGLPIVRTSVAHGTAYDIAGKGIADTEGLLAAVRVAAKLV